MAVAALFAGQHAFDVAALVRDLLLDESVSALKALRYKDAGLRKRADWEHTWDEQRREDAIDAAVAAAHPRRPGEGEAAWQARLKLEQDRRKAEQVGRLPAPPKYTSADFLRSSYWRLRGGLDVPKERLLSVPDPLSPGDWLYGWAGRNPAQRVRALAGAWIEGEQRSGAAPAQLLPLLVALHCTRNCPGSCSGTTTWTRKPTSAPATISAPGWATSSTARAGRCGPWRTEACRRASPGTASQGWRVMCRSGTLFIMVIN